MPQQREGQMPTLRKGWDNPRARGPGPAIALQVLLPQTASLAWARRVCGHAAHREAPGRTRHGCSHASVPTSPGPRTRGREGKRSACAGVVGGSAPDGRARQE